MSVFEAGRLVTARRAAEAAGLRFRGDRAFCPFHDDGRHPALSFKGQGYRCFACGEHGDAITLYAKLYGLERIDAARRLSDDFALGLSDRPPSARATRVRAAEHAARDQRRADEMRAFDLLCWAERYLRAPAPPPAGWDEIGPAHRALLCVRDQVTGILDANEIPPWGWKVVVAVAGARDKLAGG